jgi:hypothetical protein
MDVILDVKYRVTSNGKSSEMARPQEVVKELDLILKKQRREAAQRRMHLYPGGCAPNSVA